MTEPTSAVVPHEQTAPTLHLGQQSVSGENLVLPRVKIVQAMSEEKASGLAEEGNFWNTLTSEDLGNELTFAPITTFMNRLLLVRKERRATIDKILSSVGLPELSEGDGLKCRSLDMFQGNGEPGIHCNDCPLSKWHGQGNQEPPPCSEVYNVAALTDLGDFIILSFLRSSAKAGRKFFSMLRFATQGAAPYSRLYKVTTQQESIKGKGTFFVPIVSRTQEIPDTALLRQAQYWTQELGGRVLDVTPVDDVPDDDPGSIPEEGGDEPF